MDRAARYNSNVECGVGTDWARAPPRSSGLPAVFGGVDLSVVRAEFDREVSAEQGLDLMLEERGVPRGVQCIRQRSACSAHGSSAGS